MPEPAEVVTRFLSAIEAGDFPAALALVTEDVSYENVPIAPVVGKAAMEATLQGFLGPVSEVDWRVERTITNGRVVVNERVDRFRIGAGWLELPVAGFFDLTADGLISRWRDYFDMETFTRQLAALTDGSAASGQTT